MGVVAFRQKIARADVDEESREECQDQSENIFRQRKKEGGGRADYRRNGVHEKPAESFVLPPLIFKNHADGIDAVGKIMG